MINAEELLRLFSEAVENETAESINSEMDQDQQRDIQKLNQMGGKGQQPQQQNFSDLHERGHRTGFTTSSYRPSIGTRERNILDGYVPNIDRKFLDIMKKERESVLNSGIMPSKEEIEACRIEAHEGNHGKDFPRYKKEKPTPLPTLKDLQKELGMEKGYEKYKKQQRDEFFKHVGAWTD